jgi:hypothetical protein
MRGMKTLLIIVLMLGGAGCAGKKATQKKPCNCEKFEFASSKTERE